MGPKTSLSHKGYLLRTKNEEKCVPIPWWHGQFGGCLLDYTNPEAMEWWHGMMNNVIDKGVDGFKLDASDPYGEPL
jgi:alpha-glucosidase (family GH31 glycosyl hydrolase)